MRSWGELCIIVYGGGCHLLKHPKISHPKTSLIHWNHLNTCNTFKLIRIIFFLTESKSTFCLIFSHPKLLQQKN